MSTPSRRQFLLNGSALVLLAACGSKGGNAESVGEVSSASAKLSTLADWSRADDIVNSIARTDFPDKDFPITEHGAVPEDALPAIRTAIATAHDAGGGRVVVPAGDWNVGGPINLQSNVNLHISEGATLTFLPDPELYMPAVFTRWEGTECYNVSPFFYTVDAENVAITGKGKINGQGREYWLPWRKNQNPTKDRLRQMGIDLVPVEERVFGIEDQLRPHFVQFINCKRVLVEDVTLLDSPFWVVHPIYCEDVVVRNVTVISRHINSDGVDPESCDRVFIEQCSFDIDDDGVAIKAGRDNDAWRVGKPCTNIVIRNCKYLGSKGGAVAIGSEMSGGVSTVFIEGWDLPKARHGLYFKANNDRGGEIRDVHIRDIRAGDVEAMIIFTNAYKGYRGGSAPTLFADMTISDVTCDKARIGLFVKGNETAPVQNIRISDVTIGEAAFPLAKRHVENLQLENYTVGGKSVTLADSVDATEIKDMKH